jgi:WD40 repeat protein
MRITTNKAVIAIVMISLSLTACQRTAQEPTATLSPTSTPIHTKTATPSPSSTNTPTLTLTPSPERTATASPTPTGTIQWDQKSLSLTPIPRFSEVITAENADRVDALAVWGNGKANTIALSPDNQTLAVGTGIGVFLYESLNFIFIARIPTPHTVQSIAFAPDGLTIALGQSDGWIDIYNLQTQMVSLRLIVPGIDFSAPHRAEVLYSLDGVYLTSIIEIGNTIFINRWETTFWQQVGAFSIPSGLVSYVNPSTDLIGIIDRNNITLQPLSFSEAPRTIPLPASEPSTYWESLPAGQGNVVPSTTGDIILISNGQTVLYWDLFEEQVTYRLDQYPDQLPDPCFDAPATCRNALGGFAWVCPADTRLPPIETIALTPDNASMLISRNDNRSEFRRTSDGALLWSIETHFSHVAFSSNLDFFFGLTHEGIIEKRAFSNGSFTADLRQHPSQLYAVAFSPDSGVITAGFNDDWIRVFSTLNGEMLGVLDGSAHALVFSAGGNRLAAGLYDGRIRIFELLEGRNFDLSGGHFSAVTGITFSADGTALLTGSLDCTTSLWDLAGRFRRQNLTPGGADPFQIAAVDLAATDQRQFILSQGFGVFQVLEGQISTFFNPGNATISAMARSPDGRTLAAAGSSTWLIPAQENEMRNPTRELPPGANRNALALAFTPAGDVLIVAFPDGLEFWSVDDARQLAYLPFTPPGHGINLPVDIKVSRDGSLIAVGKTDGLIHIFAVIK